MPASFVQPISFGTPTDYSSDLDAIQRRMALSQALQGQALEPAQGNGGPMSWTQGAAKLAQAWASKKQEARGQEQMRALSQRYQGDYANTVRQGLSQLQGTPGSEDAAGNWTQPQAPDPAAAMATFGAHPQAAQLMPVALQEMQRQRLIEALKRGQGGATQAQPAAPQQAPQASVQYTGGQFQSQPTPQQAPAAPPMPQQQQGGVGGAAQGVPMEAWIEADPTGKLYMEQLAHQFSEGQKPVVNRGFGIGRMVNGQYVPDPASQQQALDLERQKAAISAQYAPPHQIPTEGGRDVTLFPAEQPAFMQGRLPQRLGGPAQQAPAGPAAPAAPAMPAGPRPQGGMAPATPSAEAPSLQPSVRALLANGIGRIGVSQSQEDQIRQSGQKQANVEAAKEFITEMRQNYSKLRDAPVMLNNIEQAKGLIPQARGFMGPQGESMLTAAKFLNNRLGLEINTEGVKNAEELRTRIFQQVMENLKKMDAQPSTYQQKMMEDALGKLGTDPNALPQVLDVMGDIVRKKADIHNETVRSAEKRGTTFPYDVQIRMPTKKGTQQPQASPQEIVDELRRRGVAK